MSSCDAYCIGLLKQLLEIEFNFASSALEDKIRVVSQKFYFIFISTGYVNQHPTHLFNVYSTSRNRAIGVAINLILLVNYVLVIYIGFWPNEFFTHLVNSTIVVPGFDITNRSFIGFSMKAACPAIFLHIPCAAAVIFLFTGLKTTPATTNGIGVLLALYPFFNPLIIIAFVKDYRNFVLTKLRLRRAPKQPNSSIARNHVFVSELRNVAAQHYVVTGSIADMN
ncbi:hypothetical protein ANCDUO_12883 [Ancylostoma duodenale]|uniref:G protein-coupled receptor n=1 Tax=Ancylostoma duodenale TaxID=51022 RepID=A0A0C2CKD9_9BILA|nr:hypothetical protein ANCDUO_12883 [Ancylostoma duodenale]